MYSFYHFSTSYDRWNEGRKDFGALTSDVSELSIYSSDLILAQVRNMARNIWTCVNLPPEQSAAAEKYMKSLPVYLQQPHPQRTDSGASSSAAKHTATAQNLGVAYHLRNEKIRAIKLLIAFAIATKVSLICYTQSLTKETLNSTIYETNRVWIMMTIPVSSRLLFTEKRHPVGKGLSLPVLTTSSRQQKHIQIIPNASPDLTFRRTEGQLPRHLS
jgi:predicted membrane chloride channel (bestrophin family)